jgi:hypothetical protein
VVIDHRVSELLEYHVSISIFVVTVLLTGMSLNDY